MSWINTLIPTGALVLGAALSEVSSWLADRRKTGEATRIAEAERRLAKETRRETFELDMLVKLQDALLDFGRATGKAHFTDVQIAKTTGLYGSTQLPPGIGEEVHVAGRQVLALMNMVLDDELREIVRKAYSALSAMALVLQVPVARAEREFLSATLDLSEAVAAVATRVREIYLELPPGSGPRFHPAPGQRKAVLDLADGVTGEASFG